MNALPEAVRVAHEQRRIENDEVEMRGAWPVSVFPSLSRAPKAGELYSMLFAPDVPEVNTDALRKAALLGNLMLDLDAHLRSDVHDDERTSALTFEIAATASACVPNSPHALYIVRSELASAAWTRDEARRPIAARAHELSRDASDVRRIAWGRGFAARAIAALLHRRAGSDATPLLASIDAFNAAQGALDALRFWQTDVRERRLTSLTLCLRELAPDAFAESAGRNPGAELLAVVYAHLAQPLLHEAIEECAIASSTCGTALRGGAWGAQVAGLRSTLEEILAHVQRISVPA